jgi:RNA polymerase sigma factor (sigma-70 family)
MYRNQYDSVIDKSKLAWINSRARRMGFRRQDLDDVQQQVSIALLQFNFDEARSNGASERTAITAVIDRQLRKIRRSRARHADRLSGSESLPSDITDLAAHQNVQQVRRSSDLGIAIERLSPVAQRICKCLAEGQTINEIANAMQVSWHTVHSHVAKIRECFVDLGFDELVLEA